MRSEAAARHRAYKLAITIPSGDRVSEAVILLNYSQFISIRVVMVQYNPLQYLPSAEELPDSDNTPVDELQILVPK